MATTCFLPSTPLHLRQRSATKLSKRRFSTSPIFASVSEKPSSAAPPSTTPPPAKLPLKKIPGDYGIPFFTPIKDRLDYFYFQGRDDFFKSKIIKHQSTVFRTNLPPASFISSNPKVVCLLDAKSFPILFDTAKVDKTDLFTGTYMASVELTGGYRVLSYLDPSEPNHSKLKQIIFLLLKNGRDRIIAEFHSSFTEMFEDLEDDLSAKGKAEFGDKNEQACFNFLSRSLLSADPTITKLGKDGPKIIGKWVLLQLGPLLKLGLPWLLEDLLLHTFRLPPFLIKSDYQKLYDFFYQSSTTILEEGEKLGISKDETCHNLIFSLCFNSYGGMRIQFPNMIKWIGRAGAKLHRKLAEEIRSAVRSNGGKITMMGMEQMPLMKSVVYESLRIEPPVPLQFGRAKRDLVVESHDSAFEVKEGEMIFGFQPFATKDPKVFENPEAFVADRFVGEEGEKLLKHVLWSNGPETESPTVANKQCAGKDFVVLIARLLVVEIFLRYDSFEIEVGTSALGAAVTVTSLKRATF